MMDRLKFAAKLLIAAAVLWLVWDKFNPADFQLVLNNPWLLAVIPLCWALNQLLTTMRLHAVLRALGRPTQLADVVRANMSSLFVGNLMPGVIGADVVKFYYIKKHDPAMPKAQLALVLALDRMLGLVAVLFWCSFFSLFIVAQGLGGGTRVTAYLTYVPMLALAGIVLVLVTLDWSMQRLARFHLPALLRKLVDTYRHLVRSGSRRTLGMVMLYNLAAVFVVLAGLVLVGAELQLQRHSAAMVALQFFLIPLVLIASMLPLTPMGIGIAQITMAGAYQLFGLDATLGVTISTLSQLGLLLVSVLVGGTVFLIGKRELVSAAKAR
jgi:uncharacterized protein (TIRG00374 family)